MTKDPMKTNCVIQPLSHVKNATCIIIEQCRMSHVTMQECLTLVLCSIVTTTRLWQATRSIAPPIPFTIFPCKVHKEQHENMSNFGTQVLVFRSFGHPHSAPRDFLSFWIDWYNLLPAFINHLACALSFAFIWSLCTENVCVVQATCSCVCGL